MSMHIKRSYSKEDYGNIQVFVYFVSKCVNKGRYICRLLTQMPTHAHILYYKQHIDFYNVCVHTCATSIYMRTRH